MKIISGVYHEYEGEIFLDGRKVKFKNPREAGNEGVTIIHQELNLIPWLSIAENLFLGHEITNRTGFLNKTLMRRRTEELFDRLQLDVSPDMIINRLRIGQQQLVEIAKALLLESKVLIMDEPTSAISDHEVSLLFRIIGELKNKGVAVVYISHKLDELLKIADSFTVLRDGEKIGSGNMKETSRSRIISMMVGRKLEHNMKAAKPSWTGEILRVENLCFYSPENKTDLLVNDVSFSLHKGEVLGIYGLMGSGRTEILESVFGLHPKHVTGKIIIDSEEKQIRSVTDAIEAGMALVPEDRKQQGLILNMQVINNISLAALEKITWFGFINRKKEGEFSRRYINKLSMQVPSTCTEVEKLSGGTQQKVVIARWLATEPKILLLDEPTRGIDIGSKNEIYKLIESLAAQGMGIIVVSSELPEIIAISDTILVMSESKPAAIIGRNEATEERIMKAALVERN